jgi:transposase
MPRQPAKPKSEPASPKPEGRPTLNTPETRNAILNSLAIGNTVEDSCRAAGVGYSTMRAWAVADQEFQEQIEKAQAQARQRMVGIVVSAAAAGNWQAAMTFLERRDPEHWGRKDRVSLSVDLNREARRLAQETGLDEAAILAEAEALLRNG